MFNNGYFQENLFSARRENHFHIESTDQEESPHRIPALYHILILRSHMNNDNCDIKY